MNLRRLRYFVAVADELHFGRAAARLHMAQPPLSQQIRRLETELATTLFDRSTRRVALTEAGRLLYPEAQKLLAASASIERRLGDLRTGDVGVLRLGFVDSAAYEVMPRFLRSYRLEYPRVDYELHSLSSDEQRAALVAAEIDLGIGRTAGAEDSDQVAATRFLDEQLVLGVGAGHRLSGQQTTSLHELAGEAFIGFDREVSPSLFGELRAMFDVADVDYDPIIEATEYTTILGLVASGQGIAIVPAGVQTFKPPDLRYLELTDRGARSSLLLLHRTDTSPLVDHALALVGELFSA